VTRGRSIEEAMSTNNDSNDGLFSTFLMSLASASLIEMGIVEDPISKTKKTNKESARQHLDLLSMLQDKTKGNLDENESALLTRVLTDLKIQFVKTFGDKK